MTRFALLRRCMYEQATSRTIDGGFDFTFMLNAKVSHGRMFVNTALISAGSASQACSFDLRSRSRSKHSSPRALVLSCRKC